MATASSRRGYVLRPGEGVAGFEADVKASRESTGGALTLIESRTTGGAPRHVHSREDEFFYVIEGEIIVHIGDETFTGAPGSFVYLPRGVPHDWDVRGDGLATVLMITVPSMLEEFLREFHEADSTPGNTRGEIAARYGLNFL